MMSDKFKGMPGPKTRNEMEHNLYLVLEDYIRKQKSNNNDLVQNARWATGRHLKEIKIAPNQRVVISSINERIRLQSNMLKWMEED